MVDISEIECLYIKNLWTELSRCWIKFEKPVSQDTEPWFGPLATWLNEFKESYTTIDTMTFAHSIRKIVRNSSRLSQELGYLIPNVKNRDSSCNIRNFLPVIIWTYCMNWSTPRKYAQYSPLFTAVAHGSRRKAPSEHKFDKHKGIFCVGKWQDDFKALKVRNVLVDNPGRFLSIFYRSLLFFFLLQKSSDVCNVTMSFLVFAKMTRLVELFGSEAVGLINSIISAEEPLQDDFFHDKILSFVERVMSESTSICLADSIPLKLQIVSKQAFLANTLRIYGCNVVRRKRSGERMRPLSLKQWTLLDRIYAYLFKNGIIASKCSTVSVRSGTGTIPAGIKHFVSRKAVIHKRQSMDVDVMRSLSRVQRLVDQVKEIFKIDEVSFNPEAGIELKEINPFSLFALHLQEELLGRTLLQNAGTKLSDTVVKGFDLETVLIDEEDKAAWNRFEAERLIENIRFVRHSLPKGESVYDGIYIEDL